MSSKKHPVRELRRSIYIIAGIAMIGIVIVIVLPILAARNNPDAPIVTSEHVSTSTDILTQTASVPQSEHAEPIFYEALTLNSPTISPLNELEEAVGAANVETVLKLNRIDSKFLKKGVVLTIPEDFDDFEALSPFPRWFPMAEQIPKLLLISKRVQAFGAYEYGELVRWGPVSTGTASSPTPSKLYSANWRAESTRSTVNYDWVLPWTLNIDNQIGIDIHQYDLPGYPASHSCVRTVVADAKWLYSWVDLWVTSSTSGAFRAHGGPVIIFGSYAYKETAPWKKLPDDPTATTISAEELETILAEYTETIQNRLKGRERVLGVTR